MLHALFRQSCRLLQTQSESMGTSLGTSTSVWKSISRESENISYNVLLECQ